MKSSNELQVRSEKNLPIEFSTIKENKSINELIAIMPEHSKMLETIKDSLPEVQRATSAVGGKSQSQFMDNMMTVSHNTPIRNLRQILAQMVGTRDAIKENNFKLKKKEIEAKIKRQEVDKEPNELKKELLSVEAMELEAAAETAKIYLSGAIRTLANYTAQYNLILEKNNLQNFNEEDFEKEEEKYHIMKAFEQALCAARARQGLIDEGNHIYLSQIGVNGAHAQFRITEFLREENKLLADGKAPTHKAYIDFLERMATEFAGSADRYAERKGMKTSTDSAMIQEGDTRLSDPNIPTKVMTRIKKLFALSKSPNENEAKRASEKLAKFLEKHGLTMDRIQKYLS